MKVRESGMPEEKTWTEFFSPSRILKLMGLSKEVKNVVDFGCGYGTFAIPAARMVSGKVYAIDIEPEMIKITKEKTEKNNLKNIETILRDFISNGSGLKDGSVDYVMLFNILHVDKPENLLREAYRILRDGGKLGIIHWNYDSTTPRGPSMEIRPKPEQCIDWARRVGFNNPRRYDLKPYHYGIVMEKKNEKN